MSFFNPTTNLHYIHQHYQLPEAIKTAMSDLDDDLLALAGGDSSDEESRIPQKRTHANRSFSNKKQRVRYDQPKPDCILKCLD